MKGYSNNYNNLTCEDEDKENFRKCPISVYCNIGNIDPILLLVLDSEDAEKKIDYSTVVNGEDIKENIKRDTINIYSIYFTSRMNKDIGNDVTTSYIFEVLTSDKSFGFFSQKCNGCIGMRGVVRYWGFLKFHITDVDFDPFRFVLLKIKLVDIRSSFNENITKGEELIPGNIFDGFYSQRLFGLIQEFCYGWRHMSSIWLPEYVKISNYTIHITCKEDGNYKFVIYLNKKTNKVEIRSALYDKEVHYFKYYAEKIHPINFSHPFMSITDSHIHTNVSRIIFNYEIM
ncbi:hypothetical protein RF11_05616 [Thelohanellus kitauei]|uniref:Uncharacterized protein n=1 Tax=Thelohanellus kitauei TaxID=669202 RepID=A0A0C2IUM6_THEKT|nr:hypothetical protein RF11_05616 [Thelohanellus kitauei]